MYRGRHRSPNRATRWVPPIGVAITALTVVLTTSATLAAATGDKATKDFVTYPPCVQEDGSGGPTPCFWNAQTQGNGIGESVVVHRPDHSASLVERWQP